MNREIKEIFPKEFYINKKEEMVAEVSLENLNKIVDYITNLQDKLNIYKSRCEKAIKCIKDKYYKEEYERKGTFTNKLMNILQGEDKE